MENGPNIREVFASKLRENRRKCGLTQENLAETVGISTHYLAMLETGRNFVTSDTLERLAAALEIPVFELFVTEISPRLELEQLRQDIVKEIKKEINQTVSNAIKASFADEFYKNKKK